MIRLSRRRGAINEAAADTYKRLHDNPDAYDIHTGSALNVVLDELTNPQVYTQVVQKATQPHRQPARQEHRVRERPAHDRDQPG